MASYDFSPYQNFCLHHIRSNQFLFWFLNGKLTEKVSIDHPIDHPRGRLKLKQLKNERKRRCKKSSFGKIK